MLKWTSKSSMMNPGRAKCVVNSPRHAAQYEQILHSHDDGTGSHGECFYEASHLPGKSTFDEFNTILITQPGIVPRTSVLPLFNSMDSDLNWSPLSGKQFGVQRKPPTRTSMSLPSSPEGHKKKQKTDKASSKGGIFTRFKKIFTKSTHRNTSKSLPGSPKPGHCSDKKQFPKRVQSNNNVRSQTRLERRIESKRDQRDSFRQVAQLHPGHHFSPIIRDENDKVGMQANDMDFMTMDSSKRPLDPLFGSLESTPEMFDSPRPFRSRWSSKKHRDPKCHGCDVKFQPLGDRNLLKRMASSLSNDEKLSWGASERVDNKRYSDTFVGVPGNDKLSPSKGFFSDLYSPFNNESEDEFDVFTTSPVNSINLQDAADRSQKLGYFQRTGKSPFIDEKSIQKAKQSLRPCPRSKLIPDYDASTLIQDSNTNTTEPAHAHAKNNNNGRYHHKKMDVDDLETSQTHTDDKDNRARYPRSIPRDNIQPNTTHHVVSTFKQPTVKEMVQSLEGRMPSNQNIPSPLCSAFGEKRHTSKLQICLVSENQKPPENVRDDCNYQEQHSLFSDAGYLHQAAQRSDTEEEIDLLDAPYKNIELMYNQQRDDNDENPSFTYSISKPTKSAMSILLSNQPQIQMDSLPMNTSEAFEGRKTVVAKNDSKEEPQSLSSLTRMALEAKVYYGISSKSVSINDQLESSECTDCFNPNANVPISLADDTYAGSIMSDNLESNKLLGCIQRDTIQEQKEEVILKNVGWLDKDMVFPDDSNDTNVVNVKNISRALETQDSMFGKERNYKHLNTDGILLTIRSEGDDLENIKSKRSNECGLFCCDGEVKKISEAKNNELAKANDSECHIYKMWENSSLVSSYHLPENTKESSYLPDHTIKAKTQASSGDIIHDRQGYKGDIIDDTSYSLAMECSEPSLDRCNIAKDYVTTHLDKENTIEQGSNETYSEKSPNVIKDQQLDDDAPTDKAPPCPMLENVARLVFTMPEITQIESMSMEHNDSNWDPIENMISIQKRVTFDLQTLSSSLLTTSKTSVDNAIVETNVSDLSDLRTESTMTGIDEVSNESKDNLDQLTIPTHLAPDKGHSVSSRSTTDISWYLDLDNAYGRNSDTNMMTSSFNTGTQMPTNDAIFQSGSIKQNINVFDGEKLSDDNSGVDCHQICQVINPSVSPPITKPPTDMYEVRQLDKSMADARWESDNVKEGSTFTEPNLTNTIHYPSNNFQIPCGEKQDKDNNTMTYTVPLTQEVPCEKMQQLESTVTSIENNIVSEDTVSETDVANLLPSNRRQEEKEMNDCIRHDSDRTIISSDYNDACWSSGIEDIVQIGTFVDDDKVTAKQVPYEGYFSLSKSNGENRINLNRTDNDTSIENTHAIHDHTSSKPPFSKTNEKLHRSLQMLGVKESDVSDILSKFMADRCGDCNEIDEDIPDSVSDMVVNSILDSRHRTKEEFKKSETSPNKNEIMDISPHKSNGRKLSGYKKRKRVKRNYHNKSEEKESRRHDNRTVVKTRSHVSTLKPCVRSPLRMSDIYYDRYIHTEKTMNKRQSSKTDACEMLPAEQTEQIMTHHERRDIWSDILNYRPGQWLFLATFLFLQLLLHCIYVK